MTICENSGNILYMNNLIKYMNETFGVEATVAPLEKKLLQQLPLYITSTFKAQETTIYGQRLLIKHSIFLKHGMFTKT
jgi:hypothetical protein